MRGGIISFYKIKKLIYAFTFALKSNVVSHRPNRIGRESQIALVALIVE